MKYRVTDATWERCRRVANERDARSAEATNTRVWNPDFNLIGLLGEALYAQLSGQELNESAELRDGGFDFNGIDCKATPHFASPRLLRLATDPLKAPLYWLAAIDLERHRARAVGYATRGMLSAAPLLEYGHGPTRTLVESELLTADRVLPVLLGELGYRRV